MSWVCFRSCWDFAQTLASCSVWQPAALDALLAPGVSGPFAAQVMPIVITMNSLVGGREENLSTGCCGSCSYGR